MNDTLGSKTLDEVCGSIAESQPAPAGVAVAAISAAMGLSLLLKVLKITQKHRDLIAPVAALTQELKSAADQDCLAVTRYMQSRKAEDAQALIDVPLGVIRATVRGLELCSEVKPSVTGLIAADVGAATELLAGAARAAIVCVTRNIQGDSHNTALAEIIELQGRLRASAGN